MFCTTTLRATMWAVGAVRSVLLSTNCATNLVLFWSAPIGPVLENEAELKEAFSSMVEQYGEFEAHPDNVYLSEIVYSKMF